MSEVRGKSWLRGDKESADQIAELEFWLVSYDPQGSNQPSYPVA